MEAGDQRVVVRVGDDHATTLQSSEESLRWIDRLTTVVLIGTPVMGSYVAQLAGLASLVLRSIVNPHTQIIGRIIDERSHGLQDLRTGALVDEDWARLGRRGRGTVGRRCLWGHGSRLVLL